MSLQLRLGISISENGFRRISESAATIFWKSGTDLHRSVFKETHDISLFDFEERSGVLRIGPCTFDLAGGKCSGRIQSKGARLDWNFSLRSREAVSAPAIELSRVHHRGAILTRQWTADGTVSWPGQSRTLENATLTWAHGGGKRLFEGWSFVRALHWTNSADQKPADLEFIGIMARGPGTLSRFLPGIQSFWLNFNQSTEMFSGKMWGLGIRSDPSHTDWKIHLTRGNLTIDAQFKCELRALSGTAREDTNGSALYEYSTGLGSGELAIYRDGKLEGNYLASSTVCLEHGTRTRDPYLQIQA